MAFKRLETRNVVGAKRARSRTFTAIRTEDLRADIGDFLRDKYTECRPVGFLFGAGLCVEKQRAVGDARLLGDVARADALVAALREQRFGGGDDALALLLLVLFAFAHVLSVLIFLTAGK